MSERVLNWGLLSTARINRALIPALRSSARNRLTAVASRNQASAEAYAREWKIGRALGSYEALLDDPEIDVVEIGPVAGERYLLCSDGLFGPVPDERIAELLGDRSAPLEDICGRLIDAANAAGGPDNITAMVLQIDAP